MAAADTAVTDQQLRELAEVHAADDSVLSLFLDLDPSEFAVPSARASEIDSLLDLAHKQVEHADRGHDELMALRGALERAREILAPAGEALKGARGLALFIAPSLDLERVLRLPHPVSTAAVVGDRPFIAPLAEQRAGDRVAVALVDERFARVLRGSAERLREIYSFGDDVHGRQSTGGWSQARYQRSFEEDVEAHLRRVARTLADVLRVTPYDRLLIACTQPLWPRVTDKLGGEVRARLRDERVSLDVGDASIEDALEAVRPILEAERREHVDARLAELREGVGRDGDERAATGLGDVLRALGERRVESLLYDPDLSVGGVVCPKGDWMSDAGERCPVDGEPLQRRDDMLELAIESAVGQDADLVAVRDRPDLGPLGGIAATLRF